MTTYRIVRVCEQTIGRAAGLAAIRPGVDDAFRQGITLAAGIGERETGDRIVPASSRAAAAFRSRIMSASKDACPSTWAMLKGLRPSDIAHALEHDGGLTFGCPVTGTWAVFAMDADCGTGAMSVHAADAADRRTYAMTVRENANIALEAARDRFALAA